MTGSYFERSALKSYMKIPCKFLVAKLSSFQQFLVSSLREALSYLLLENQMSHASHASHTSHPLATFSSRYALHQASFKAPSSSRSPHPSPCGALLATFFKQCGSGGRFSLAQGVCGCGRLAQPRNLHSHGHHRSMRRTLYGIDRIYRLP